MSAPNTNLEKQKRRHKGPLVGMRLVVIFAFALLLGLLIWTFWQTDGPEGSETQIDGRTGEEVIAE